MVLTMVYCAEMTKQSRDENGHSIWNLESSLSPTPCLGQLGWSYVTCSVKGGEEGKNII